jgi:hypothetical protein
MLSQNIRTHHIHKKLRNKNVIGKILFEQTDLCLNDMKKAVAKERNVEVPHIDLGVYD